MRTERPKVIYNNLTSQYVMWGYADNYDRTLRMSFVATSCWPSGPFTFNSVQLPDRAESTTDLTLFQNSSGAAFLARTYYINQTYSMPRPIMQPTWESVKSLSSTFKAPVVDYAMNYHRAFYAVGYDNFKDIYTQEWRMEDRPWWVIIGTMSETYQVTTGMFQLTNLVNGALVATYAPVDREDILTKFTDPTLPREIKGQVGVPPLPGLYHCWTQLLSSLSIRAVRL
jgi:hypothetical protein